MNVGDRVHYTVTAVDGDDPLVSLAVSGTPNGASLTHYPLPRANPVSATLDWIADRRGVFEVQYVASDGDPRTVDPHGSVLIVVTRPFLSRIRPFVPGVMALVRRGVPAGF